MRHRLSLASAGLVRRLSRSLLAGLTAGLASGLIVAALLAAPAAHAGFVVFEGTGATPAGITSVRDAFRAQVGGGTVAGANGDFGGLRREINWDGVPDGFADPTALPGDFFNVNSPRGAVFSTPGTGFLVSANANLLTPTLFGFASDLQTFSVQRLFASVGSNVTDVRFFVPGTSTAATVTAFGLIFVDVEVSNATLLEFFDANGTQIFSRFAGATGNQGLSFVGGVADAGERIARVRITTPANYLLANGSRLNEDIDFVVMDDFLYAAPVALAAIPTPAPLVLGVLGLVGLALRSRTGARTRAGCRKDDRR